MQRLKYDMGPVYAVIPCDRRLVSSKEVLELEDAYKRFNNPHLMPNMRLVRAGRYHCESNGDDEYFFPVVEVLEIKK